MTECQRHSPRECTLCGVVEEVDDVLEDKVVVLTDRNEEVVCGNTITLTIFNQGARLVSLRDLNILRNAAEDLVGLAVVETDQDEP